MAGGTDAEAKWQVISDIEIEWIASVVATIEILVNLVAIIGIPVEDSVADGWQLDQLLALQRWPRAATIITLIDPSEQLPRLFHRRRRLERHPAA